MNQAEAGSSTSPMCLRIIVLDLRADLWCDACAALSATAITYVVEEGGSAPRVMFRLTYCTTCDGE
jgi:hypothetical protein